MLQALFQTPTPINDPVRDYAPGSRDRALLDAALHTIAEQRIEIPIVVDGRPRKGTEALPLVMPHNHRHVLASVEESSAQDVDDAIAGALRAAPAWQALSFDERAAIFLRAADMLAGPWRHRINAACMLGQSKTCHQAEIDAACELVDFFRFNVHFARQIFQEQPFSPPGQWNRLEYRPLEGFVFAVTPFNFLSIAINLPTAPALLGNVVVWKPSHTSMLGAWHMLELLREAGLPDGVIQLVPGRGPEQGAVALASKHLAGIHFTGSTGTFHALQRGVSERIAGYRNLPRIVGETGGKDFIVVHNSADIEAASVAALRGAFEFQGQKCSAASRMYVARSVWNELRDRIADGMKSIKIGDVRDYQNFMGAVIDERSFDKISGYQRLAKESANCVAGGSGSKEIGFFIEPTFVEVNDPKHRLMEEEIFGPVLSAYVYEDSAFEDTLKVVDSTSMYALTGAIFANDRTAISTATSALRQAAGNFYINDKPTGAVVGQQPFGGARQSGTNDKAGSPYNLLRFLSPRTLKETLTPPRDWRYPYMG